MKQKNQQELKLLTFFFKCENKEEEFIWLQDLQTHIHAITLIIRKIMKKLPKETDIILLIENQEQSNLVQKICFALNVRWISSGYKIIDVTNGACICISTDTDTMQIASKSFRNTDTETFINEYYEVLGMGKRIRLN